MKPWSAGSAVFPEVPEDFPWPQWDDHGPLTFIASIDCGRLPPSQLGMPDTGTLPFFYYDDQMAGTTMTVQSWDETPACATVAYIPGGTPIAERDHPAGIEPYSPVPLTGELRTTGPDWTHPALRDAVTRMSADDQTFMDDWSNGDSFRNALWEQAPSPRHQIGGHAYPIGGAVENGGGACAARRRSPQRQPYPHQGAMLWRLLAQFDTDDQAEMAWGDTGTLDRLIRPEDLAARRFNAASFTWQH